MACDEKKHTNNQMLVKMFEASKNGLMRPF